MEKYINAVIDAFWGSIDWTWKSILFEVPWYTNYFWGLTVISLVVWGLEIAFPWRKEQSVFRKDFWLDGFYMYFNFFLFAIAISGFYKLLGLLFNDLGISAKSLTVLDLSAMPMWAQLVIFFISLPPTSFLKSRRAMRSRPILSTS